MSSDHAPTARAKKLWEHLAGTAAGFAPAVSIAVSPQSRLCRPGWIGIVTIADAVLATAPAFAVREHGQVMAAAGYRDWPCGTAHLCVLTAAEGRGRGLARAAASAAVAHAISEGKLPQWRARPGASRRVARALGFRELGSQVSIRVAVDVWLRSGGSPGTSGSPRRSGPPATGGPSSHRARSPRRIATMPSASCGTAPDLPWS
jgi:hypothetical protein